jgi:hypothetical protein
MKIDYPAANGRGSRFRRVNAMIDISTIDYSRLDRPEVLMFLFHPRPEWCASPAGGESEDLLIPVERDVVIGARFHLSGSSASTILFFHGNGEIVADYDDIGHLYKGMDINFLPVDYRGYGRSTGSPTITSMMRDCHVIFDFVRKWLLENDHIIPHADGQALYDASTADDKRLLTIPDADHNTIFLRGMSEYMEAVNTLVKSVIMRSSG